MLIGGFLLKMADYGEPINAYEYIYSKTLNYVGTVTDGSDVIIKLDLNSSVFNFDLAKSDGSDFRLMDNRYGAGVLITWIAYWYKPQNKATIFFKLPKVYEESITLKAYWGNSSATAISSPTDIGFLFYEGFDSVPISSSKWSGTLTSSFGVYGLALSNPTYGTPINFTSTTSPLSGVKSWVCMAGMYAAFGTTGWNSAYRAAGFGFEGTENNFLINFMHNHRIEHNAVMPGSTTYAYVDKNYIGFEPYGYQEVNISYYEPDDTVRVRQRNRVGSFGPAETDISRKVEGDTRMTQIHLFGSSSGYQAQGAYPAYISWLIMTTYDKMPVDIDASPLYIPFANVPHSAQDFRSFLPDLTNTLFQHETSYGGDPYNLSNEDYTSDTGVWISNDGAESESEVVLTIHTGWTNTNLVNRTYGHIDSGHVYKYSASKLSGGDTDDMSYNFWKATTTSGFAAIDFQTQQTVGALRIKCTTNLNAAPKDFIFYGSNYNPLYNFNKAIMLAEGSFLQTQSWQSVVLTNVGYYKYYILYINNTFGGQNIEIQEWQMLPSAGRQRKSYVNQLRLHPAMYSNWQYNFPLEISLQGSVDNIVWDTLIDWTPSYTPFIVYYTEYGYWQRYSFVNSKGHWSYRLRCRGNWQASDTKIIIGEWSLHELAEEAYTYRILSGGNSVQQIWASPTCGIDTSNAIIYVANEYMNKISVDKLINAESLPSYYEDFNVV